MGKMEEMLPKVVELFEAGKTQKEIAQIMGVTEATLVSWKKQCEGSLLDWEERKWKAMQNKKSVASWLEEQIQATMLQIEEDQGNEYALTKLDKFISMKKKYDGSIDKLGETMRVMEAFASFVRENFPNDMELIKEITNSFMRYMGR